MTGEAGIFTFPFRFYVGEEIREVEARHFDGRHVLRLYKPWVVRKSGAPLSPDVPFSDWPQFSWNPKLPQDKRLKPPTLKSVNPGGTTFVDALRVDVRGPSARSVLDSFTVEFVRWVRHLSRQPWIGEYEPQSDPLLKYGFRCDSQGRAIDAPFAYGKGMAFAKWMVPIDNGIWAEAVRRASIMQEPEPYWDLFFDSHIQRSVHKVSASLLSLVLALEVGRDRNFPRFAPTKEKRGIGTVLDKPFEDTPDLLKHLSTHIEELISRNLEKECPEEWTALSKLYIARHKIAHGGPAVILEDGAMREATLDDAKNLADSVFLILRWMEQL